MGTVQDPLTNYTQAFELCPINELFTNCRSSCVWILSSNSGYSFNVLTEELTILACADGNRHAVDYKNSNNNNNNKK